jgi:hypothetical protein
MLDFDADLDTMMDVADFGEVVLIRNEAVTGIFNFAWVNPAEVGARPKPAFWGKASDVEGVEAGEELVRQAGGSRVNVERYVVTNVIPDEAAGVTLELRAA